MSTVYKMIPDLPQGGPLEKYRRKASFDWKQLKIYLEGEASCQNTLKAYSSVLSNPDFHGSHEELTAEEQLHRNWHRFKFIFKNIPTIQDPKKLIYIISFPAKIMNMIDTGLFFKRTLSHEICLNVIYLSKRDISDEVNGLIKEKYHSCIALTEIGHGSNLLQLQTIATYNKESDGFIINTPSIEAWKCWSGNLGKCATHALLLAQLHTPDGKCHGLHWFFIAIRDPRTMQPYPGVLVGNMGNKIGLNSLDNGFMSFTNYYVPRKTLINSFGDITPNGEYTTSEPNPAKRFAMVASSLNHTRYGIAMTGFINLKKGMVIAVRYAAVRKQFGPKVNSPEVQIIEYPLHQYRLMPYLCASIVFDFTYDHFLLQTINYQEAIFANNSNKIQLSDVTLASVHMVAVGLKVLITWIAKDGLQEARECCGGHGYLKAAGIGGLVNDVDSLVTLEGDNNILSIQITKILLSAYKKKLEGEDVEIEFGLYDFFKNMDQTLTTKCDDINKLFTPAGIIEAYNWLMCYLIHEFASTLTDDVSNGATTVEAFNKLQPFYAKHLAMAFAENMIIRAYFDLLKTNPPPQDCALVLVDVGMLYALWSLERHLLFLCKGNYFAANPNVNELQKTIGDLCLRVKDESVALADVIAPPDQILNSLLGYSDGEVYKRLVAHFMSDGKNLQRPYWWKEMCSKPIETSKL